MIRNYIKISFRSFFKKKVYFFINVTGLSISMTLCMLVFLYVKNEYSRDSFHENKDNIYALQEVNYLKDNANMKRSVFDTKKSTEYRKSAYLQIPAAEALLERMPEIEQISRFGFGDITIKKDAKRLREKAKYVDENFLEFFSFDVISGNRETALDRPDKVVLTEAMALKYFGAENPLGKYLELDVKDSTARSIYEVGGVVEIPSNSSLRFDFLFRIENNYYYRRDRDNWDSFNTPSFVYLSPNADLGQVHAKLDEFVKEKFGDEDEGIRAFRGISEDSPIRSYRLVKLTDIYFDFEAPIGESSQLLYSLILVGIALLILFIGCINYISISIATSSSRKQEIGVRKVVGGTQRQLFGQLYSEMLLLSLISGALSFTLTQIFLPFFNDLTGVPILLTETDTLLLMLFALIFSILVSLVSGIYPALMLSKFKAVNALKGRTTHRLNPGFMKGLVTFQFSLCILFLSLSTTMHRQFNYISAKDLGFEEEAVVYLNGASGLSEQLRQELLKHPAVSSVSGSEGIFSGGRFASSRTINGVRHMIRAVFTDFDFVNTFEMDLLQGRNLSEEFGEDKNDKSCVINETYWNLLQQDSTFDNTAHSMNIVGVIKDFHFDPLTKQIDPLYIKIGGASSFSRAFIKLDANMLDEGIKEIKKVWSAIAPERIYDLKFLDSTLEEKYGEQKRWNGIINSASIFGILIACIGLFGLTGINAMNRTKEIGIRKVLGANFKTIVYLLNKSTLWIILISILIATPVAIYLIDQWLGSFAYKIDITYDIFLITTLLCSLIVLLTVSFHSVKTSLINPTELLRDE